MASRKLSERVFGIVAAAIGAWLLLRSRPVQAAPARVRPAEGGTGFLSAPASGPYRDPFELATVPTWITPPAGWIYDPHFRAAELRAELPPGMLSRVAYQESRYDRDAYNPSGATGLMQIIPRWHPDVNATDPIASIYYAAEYLAENYRRFDAWDKALAAYNWGPTNVARAISDHGENWLRYAPSETRNYVRDVVADTMGVRIA